MPSKYPNKTYVFYNPIKKLFRALAQNMAEA